MPRRLSLLIVDDNTDLAENIQEILEDEGFDAAIAADGEEALRRIDGGAYDLVITDIRMPGINGVDLLRQINQRVPGTPVVMMTAYSQDALLEQAQQEGALDVLSKPVDMERLQDSVSRVADPSSRVLLVEEDAATRVAVMQALVTLEGVVPCSATSVAQAEQMAERVPLDAAIIDVLLPDGLGTSLGDALRTKLGERDLPVVYIDDERADVEVEESDSTRIIRKPFRPEDLVGLVREVT